MSRGFRAVKETWGAYSDQFIAGEDLIALLEAIGTEVDTPFQNEGYGDKDTIWFEKGTAVLNFMEQQLTVEKAAAMLHEVGADEQNADELEALVQNLRLLAANEWRTSIGKHGELVIYVD